MEQSISLKEVVTLKQYAEQIMQIIEHCESIQEDDGVSDYHKERAKVHAYEDIVALVKVRPLGGDR